MSFIYNYNVYTQRFIYYNVYTQISNMGKRKRCPECNTILVTLYYRKKRKEWTKIEALYCRQCKKPTILQELNWFKD